MKKLILTAICGCMAFIALAQAPTATIKGLITDSATQKPLGLITLSLKDSAGTQGIKSTLTKADGSFEINKLPVKHYQLSVVAVGYATKTIPVNFASATMTDLGTIQLAPSNGQLKEVGVTASRPLIKQEIDRLSYDVQADPDSKALTAMDMMRRVPLLSVDGDDNIQLQSSSSYRIFINGKPSALLASNPKDVLRSMPASSIQKIEVITTPPSKYDGEGLAGIINIITTKKTEDGYNGTVTSRYSLPWGPSINLTGTAKANKFGISGTYGMGRQRTNTMEFDNLRQTFDPAGSGNVSSTFLQQGTNTYGGNYLYSSLEASYEVDTLNLFTGSLNYNLGSFDQDQNRFTTYNAGTFAQSYLLLNNGGFNWKGLDAGLNYQLGAKRNKQQLFTASYRYSYSLDGRANDLSAQERVNYNVPDYTQQNDAGYKEHTFQLDEVYPIKGLTIEGGAKAILRNAFSRASGQQLLGGTYVTDPSRRNDFDYHQDVYAAYNSYQLKLTKWTFKAGVRLEHTRVDANFITDNNTLLKTSYTNVIPSLSVMHTLPNNQSLTFGYTSRLERPYIFQLNPFVDRSNPQLLSTGNPDLQAVTGRLFELTHTKTGKGTLTNKLSYIQIDNNIVNVLALRNDTSVTTYDNAGNVKILRWNISGNYTLANKLTLSFNTGLFYVWVKGPYMGQFFSNKGWRTNTNANLTYKPTDTWTFGLGGGFNRRYIFLQGGSNDYVYSSLSASKMFLNKKLTVSTVLSNPYQARYKFTQFTSTPDLYQSNTGNQFYRTFSLSLSYKFGKLSSDIKKNKRTINNDDKSGSNGN
ncbi:TonB-dependent receptor [Mucilaginibacter daejeonensis]|uniref:outer membrane beta-barrel family protein n=1 Tax=Mucilaginibacter daejeonensis TaxID=398049 RepID=UPI001D177C81|nr:outer membrane beta-barrel family protein [Mucilaginibacter daejeonensis]UEG53873.1 TonB-dependent receptor [Mucilaginibacter daejeonensis]